MVSTFCETKLHANSRGAPRKFLKIHSLKLNLVHSETKMLLHKYHAV